MLKKNDEFMTGNGHRQCAPVKVMDVKRNSGDQINIIASSLGLAAVGVVAAWKWFSSDSTQQEKQNQPDQPPHGQQKLEEQKVEYKPIHHDQPAPSGYMVDCSLIPAGQLMALRPDLESIGLMQGLLRKYKITDVRVETAEDISHALNV